MTQVRAPSPPAPHRRATSPALLLLGAQLLVAGCEGSPERQPGVEQPGAEAARELARASTEGTAAGPTEALTEKLTVELERTAELWQAAGEPLLAAAALREAGSAWYRLGRSSEATARFRRALPLVREAGDAHLEVSLLNRLGLALLDGGDTRGARQTLGRALDRARQTGQRPGEASALNNLALVDETVGETHRAVERYQLALPIWRELGSAGDLVKTSRNLADALGLLDHHQEALHLLEEALALARRTGDRSDEARVLLSTAWIRYQQGRSLEGIPLLRQALELWRELDDRVAEAAGHDRLATLLRETGDFAAALAAYERSRALSAAADRPWDVARTAGNIGCLLQERGRPRAALAELTEARRSLRAVDDPKSLSHVELCLALAQRGLGDLAAALEHLEAALSIVDELRLAARRSGARYRPIWLWQDYAELHHELLMARYRATGDERFAARAFAAADLSRGRGWLELVAEARLGVRATAQAALLDREREIRERLSATDDARRLSALELELEQARAKIRAADERYVAATTPHPVELEALQSRLEPGTVILSYALGEERSYLFAVSRDALTTWTLLPRATLDAHAEALYKALVESRFTPFQERLAARALGGLMMPPGAIPADAERLLVVVEGSLNYVPMSVLPSPREAPPRATGDEVRLLVDDFELRRLPTASLLGAPGPRRDRPGPEKTLAVVADPVFSAEDPRLASLQPAIAVQDSTASAPGLAASTPRSLSVEELPRGPLPRLPFTGDEAEAILGLVPPAERWAALGFSASKETVLGTDLRPYRIVHFATHARIDERFPELSSLVFSRLSSSGEAIDGELFLHEIYGLELAADLVVLSACQTALGRHVRGDGLLGLTRGFLYAGSAQVVVSLWSVDDEATSALMAELYRGLLQRGEPPAVALRSAQRWMRRQERWQAPYFWAPFVLLSGG